MKLKCHSVGLVLTLLLSILNVWAGRDERGLPLGEIVDEYAIMIFSFFSDRYCEDLKEEI